MGYHTHFKGSLSFTNELSMDQFKRLRALDGEFSGDHPEWEPGEFKDYIDLEFNKELTALLWDRLIKTYSLEETIQFIIDYMNRGGNEFGLIGTLTAQGEDIADRYKISVCGKEVKKIRVDVFLEECPECGHRWEKDKKS